MSTGCEWGVALSKTKKCLLNAVVLAPEGPKPGMVSDNPSVYPIGSNCKGTAKPKHPEPQFTIGATDGGEQPSTTGPNCKQSPGSLSYQRILTQITVNR